MALSQDDKDWVKLISREVAFQVNKEVIASHIKSCPHGKTLLASKWFLMGVCIGSGFAGGGLALGVAKIIVGL